jgi:hypothetical protein
LVTNVVPHASAGVSDAIQLLQRTSDAPPQVVFDTWWPDHPSLSRDRVALL